MKRTRAVFVATVLGLIVANAASAQVIRITLLGTGSPEANPDRFGPATLVEAGAVKLILRRFLPANAKRELQFVLIGFPPTLAPSIHLQP